MPEVSLSLYDEYTQNEYWWSFLMLVISFSNEVHTGLIIAYGTVFAQNNDYPQSFFLLTCFFMGASIPARCVNAIWLLKLEHVTRIHFVCGA